MTTSEDAAPATRRRRWWLLGGLAAAVIAVIATVLVVTSEPACGCAIPPSEDAAIDTARGFVAGVAAGTDDIGDPARVASLAALDDPATVWAVVHTRRPEGGYGDSPAVRVIVGLAPGDTWDAVAVRTERDYEPGEVDAEVRQLDDSGIVAVRGGATPLFDAGDTRARGDDHSRTVALLRTGREPESLSALDDAATWVYTGDGLPPGRYLVVRGGENVAHDPPRPYAAATWFEVPEPTG